MKILDSNQHHITEKPFLTYFPLRQEPKGTVLVFPGGGYVHVSSQKEGSDIAAAFNREGFQVFVLDYRVHPYTGRDFLRDAVSAMRTVRSFLLGNGFADQKLALMGFSAGGHLALMETQHWQEVLTDEENENCRPDALILCYPVVTFSDPYAHQGSRANFLGEGNVDDPVQIEKYSAEKNVGPDFPPTFLWHCEGDKSVPVQNSLMLRDAMENAGVPHKLILYKDGAHGLGLAKNDPIISGWFAYAASWLEQR